MMNSVENNGTLIAQAIQFAFTGLGDTKEHHVNEIVEYIKNNFDACSLMEPNIIQQRVQSYLARNVKSKQRKYKKAINSKTKRFKKGFYVAVNRKDERRVKLPSLAVNARTSNNSFNNEANTGKLYLGKAGELAVISELIFRGYNASLMNVDEGIDITASKSSDFYFIQVKTTNFVKDRIYVSIPSNNFVKANGNAKIFYIIVFRYLYENPQTYQNRFLIFSKADIDRFVYNKTVKSDDGNVQIKIKYENQKLVLYNELKSEPVDYFLDNFASIK